MCMMGHLVVGIVYVYNGAYVCMHVSVYVFMCSYVCMYVFVVCMCLCVRMCVYIYKREKEALCVSVCVL